MCFTHTHFSLPDDMTLYIEENISCQIFSFLAVVLKHEKQQQSAENYSVLT